MRLVILLHLACFLLVDRLVAGDHDLGEHSSARMKRAIAEDGAEGENEKNCRYEKAPWGECEPASGLQKRRLRLRTKKSSTPSANNANCPSEKFLERPCKKLCKYTKGPWSDCTNGSKERTDQLKAQVSAADCKVERKLIKPCKKQCSYEKSEWSACLNGEKSKTLILIESSDTTNAPDCEQEKKITKQCNGNKANKASRKMRKPKTQQQD